MRKLLLATLLVPMFLFGNSINLDTDEVSIHLKNNKINILNFPFIIHKAKLASETPEDFSTTSKNKSVIIIPTAKLLEEGGDLLIWSALGDPYLIKIDASGKTSQKFNFALNKIAALADPRAVQFESGRIVKDLKKILKYCVKGENIPGYQRTDVKKAFETKDLFIQKEFFQNGGKYRVETWYLQNKTNKAISLDYSNFYTNGILLTSFQKKTLEPGQVSKMWLVINKATIADNIKRRLNK